MLTGMDARAANITSTLALFPAQVATGWTGRKSVAGAAGLPFRVLVIISLFGGALGAILLLDTPQSFFARMIPWLVLFDTAVFAWGIFGPKRPGAGTSTRAARLARSSALPYTAATSVVGIGFLMLAALTAAGVMMGRGGHQECTGRGDECLRSVDLCILAGGPLVGGRNFQCGGNSGRGSPAAHVTEGE